MPTLCSHLNCKKRASYGDDNNKNMFCREHKTDDMFLSYHKKCEFESCKIEPNFNFDGEKKGRFCNKHKLDNMVDVTHNKCKFLNCKIQSCYNFDGEKKGIFCSTHKLDGMIDVKTKKCEFNNCKLIPCFNYEGLKTRRFCSNHKLDNMVDIGHQKCLHLNCKIQPCYNFYGEKNTKFCFFHKLDDMVDVKHKHKCEMIDCSERSYFNFKGESSPRFCSIHKLNDMIDVVNPRCFCGKSTGPSFNFKGLKPIYCASCRKVDMVNVKHDSCKNDGCPSVANKKYKNYCAYCFQHLFPQDPLTFQIRCKTKELAVRDFINANYEGFNHDKILEYGGCDCLTRRRIDHRKLIGNTLLCIETDENQHKSYSKADEEARYNDLLVNFTCKYIIIRFNPDSYVNKKGVKTNPYISARLEELKKEMDKQIKRIENNENAELLEVVHLYYDGYK
jgi:hypothetical protein